MMAEKEEIGIKTQLEEFANICGLPNCAIKKFDEHVKVLLIGVKIIEEQARKEERERILKTIKLMRKNGWLNVHGFNMLKKELLERKERGKEE